MWLLNRIQRQLRNISWSCCAGRLLDIEDLVMKMFDFEPQFLAEQITGQSLWDPEIREVGQSFWDRGRNFFFAISPPRVKILNTLYKMIVANPNRGRTQFFFWATDFRAHILWVLFIIPKVKILFPLKWSYRSFQFYWLCNFVWEWSYFGHVVHSLLSTCIFLDPPPHDPPHTWFNHLRWKTKFGSI